MELSTTIHSYGSPEVLEWAIRESRDKIPNNIVITRESGPGTQCKAKLHARATQDIETERVDLGQATDFLNEKLCRGLELARFLKEVYGLNPERSE